MKVKKRGDEQVSVAAEDTLELDDELAWAWCLTS